jgi:hypothetical protein
MWRRWSGARGEELDGEVERPPAEARWSYPYVWTSVAPRVFHNGRRRLANLAYASAEAPSRVIDLGELEKTRY